MLVAASYLLSDSIGQMNTVFFSPLGLILNCSESALLRVFNAT